MTGTVHPVPPASPGGDASGPGTPVDLSGFAALAGLKPATLRTYRTDGRLPPPDGRHGRSDWWWTATVQTWLANRPGQGARTDLTRDPDPGEDG